MEAPIFNPQIPTSKPIITKILVTLILIFFIIEVLTGALNNERQLIFLGAKWNYGIKHGEYWRFITCTFLHGNLYHLLLNTVAIYTFGKEVESLYGSYQFLIFFLLSSWGATLCSFVFSNHLSIGASGFAFGLIGNLIVFYFLNRKQLSGANNRLKTMYTLAILNIIFSFILPNIDNFAHLGGLITGIISSISCTPKYQIKSKETIEGSYSYIHKQDKLISDSIYLFSVFLLLSILTTMAVKA